MSETLRTSSSVYVELRRGCQSFRMRRRNFSSKESVDEGVAEHWAGIEEMSWRNGNVADTRHMLGSVLLGCPLVSLFLLHNHGLGGKGLVEQMLIAY